MFLSRMFPSSRSCRSARKLLRVVALLMSVALFAAACDSVADGSGTAVDDGSGSVAAAGPTDTLETVQGGNLLATIQDRGGLHCGVSGASVAFSETQPDGSQRGFDVDYCRAVAADAEAGRLLGGEGELQSLMGLAPDAFYQVIKQVGNYNDI